VGKQWNYWVVFNWKITYSLLYNKYGFLFSKIYNQMEVWVRTLILDSDNLHGVFLVNLFWFTASVIQISIGFLVCLLGVHVTSFSKRLFIEENKLYLSRSLYKQIFMTLDVQLASLFCSLWHFLNVHERMFIIILVILNDRKF